MNATQAFILCGGLGTRLGSMVKETPKPMLPVGGKPILQHTVEHLKQHGITKVILGAGYKAEVVAQFFTNLDWGMDITVSTEKERLGTAGALTLVADQLDDQFLVVYGDVFIDFDVRAMIDGHVRSGVLATILARPSTHPWDADLIQTKEGYITEFVTEHEPGKHYQNMGNAAIYVLSKRILSYIPKEKSDFMKDIFPKALAAGEKIRIHPLDPGEFVRDIGKPERFRIVEQYLKDRKAIRQAKEQPKPVSCVFLDRDGVLNIERSPVHVHRPDQLEISPGVPEAIKLFNNNDITTVVITNQAVVARGLCTESTLELIHSKLQREIENSGGHLDVFYSCPHHPETHHGEGVSKLRKGCNCRKPANGMLLQARNDLDLDLAGCVMIGNSSTDIEAGKNAGVRTIFISGDAGVIKKNVHPDYTFNSLLDAAKAIIGGNL